MLATSHPPKFTSNLPLIQSIYSDLKHASQQNLQRTFSGSPQTVFHRIATFSVLELFPYRFELQPYSLKVEVRFCFAIESEFFPSRYEIAWILSRPTTQLSIFSNKKMSESEAFYRRCHLTISERCTVTIQRVSVLISHTESNLKLC